MWETFFLGTARRTDSQISAIRLGSATDSAAGLKSVWGMVEVLWMNGDHRPAAGEEAAARDRSSDWMRGMAEDSNREAMVQ